MENNFINRLHEKFSAGSRASLALSRIRGAYINYERSNSGLWVASLSYFCIMSLIPLVAIGFSFGKFLGIDNFLANQLYNNSPLDESSLGILLEAAQNLLENTRSGLLAGIGFIFLGWIIISMFTLIEKSMNVIWRVEKARTFFRRVTDYLTVFMIFPLTLLSLNILTGNNSTIAKMIPHTIFILAPYFSVWLFFTVFYVVMPNTRVHIIPAAISGLFVSIVFNQSNLIFLKLQIFITAYNKIYGSFSIILIFLIWLKIVWFLILIGVHLTYILQNSQSLSNIDGISKLSFESKFRITVTIGVILTKNYIQNEVPLSSKEISKNTGIPLEMVIDVLEVFKKMNIVFESNSYDSFEKVYKLSYNHEEFTVGTIFQMWENYGENYSFSPLVDFKNMDQKLSELTLK